MNETPTASDQATSDEQKARVNFLTPKQCAEQFRLYAQSHPNEGSKHSLGFCANFLDEFCIQALEADKTRLDWLEERYVIVRNPARYGSHYMFECSPVEQDGYDDKSDIRKAIDVAMEATKSNER